MGASSSADLSTVHLPERIDLSTAKRLAGSDFDDNIFQRHAGVDACVPSAIFAQLLSHGRSPDSAADELRRSDPDLTAESKGGVITATASSVTPASRCPFARLRMRGRTHIVSSPTKRMLEHLGGVDALRRLTTNFYKMAFVNPHLRQFFRSFDDPHAERLATWIAEKMGDPAVPWSRERETRDRTPVIVADGYRMVVHDRSSAHAAAWYSPKRSQDNVGRRFKLDDARLWMRLNFLAARQVGLFDEPNFEDWYTRFIAHFMRVYHSTAPQFARESARWSQSKENVSAYKLAVSRGLSEAPGPDPVVGTTALDAVHLLPREERAENTRWPYEQ